MKKSQEGDEAKIWFPNLTMDMEAAKEFGYGGRDHWGYPIAPVTEFHATYENGRWYCHIPEWDDSLTAKTLPQLVNMIKDYQIDDQLVAKVGPAKYKIL